MQGNITIHEVVSGGNRFTLTLGLSEPICDKEGELSLDLLVDGEKVFVLSFTIVPGWIVKSEAPEILLIAHLQGVKGTRNKIRLARSALRDYSPRATLFAALQGIGDAFGIGDIGAVCASKQRAYTRKCADTLKSGYDTFFEKVGMLQSPTGFYVGHIPVEGKPLASYKGRNRSRARKRREMRRRIRSSCASFFLEVVNPLSRPPVR